MGALEKAIAGWVDVAALDEIPRLGARTVPAHGGNIAVFRTADDQVFALRDACPHKGGPLSQGIVSGCKVYCPLHSWCIGLEDGTALAPDEGQTGTFPAQIENGRVLIKLGGE